MQEAGAEGFVQKRSGSSHIAASSSSQESPAARSLQIAAEQCITALHHCHKGRQSHRTSSHVHASLPLHSSSLESMRGLSSLTSCAIFGPNFLLHTCPCSFSISVATAHVFSRQGAL